MKTRILIILSFFFLHHCAIGQHFHGRRIFGKDFAKKEIKKLTNDSSQYNSINKKLLLANKKSAINFADSVLFKEYGKENILGEKPYEIYLIDNYWWIKGTMLKQSVGGTCKLVVNAVDKKVIWINHQK